MGKPPLNWQHFLKTAGAVACSAAAKGGSQEGKADFTLHICKMSFEAEFLRTIRASRSFTAISRCTWILAS
jgi:hypothetical protein